MSRDLERDDVHTDAVIDAIDQTADARAALLLPASSHLRLPFPSLDRLVGHLSPSDVWFVAAFSGNGKTALLMSLVLAMLAEGRTVYYLGLESRPHILRTHLACARLGYDVGDVLSGAAKGWPEWPSVRAEILQDFEKQRALGPGYTFLVNGQPYIDCDGLTQAFRNAAYENADLVIIDHIDHVLLEADSSAYQQSRLVIQHTLSLAHQYERRVLASTQLNNEAVRGDRLAVYAPPQPQHVFMGGHKRQIATGMLGLFRPQRPDATKDELKAVREHAAEPSTVLEPNTMGVVCMKHRHYGNREGQRITLGVRRGIVSEMNERDRYTTSYEGQRRI